jgi:RimJ/RimL family protein N-acetyltransferase
MKAARTQADIVPTRLIGARVVLVPFTGALITPRYLGWLADGEVNRYSRRLGQPAPSAEEARAWLAGLARDEIVYVIETDDFGHVGNVKYGPIKWSNLSADISIVLGERQIWGQGYGAEAIYVVSRHLFQTIGLNRLHAGSVNPAFVRVVEKLGWRREGVQREQARIGGRFHDSVLLSMLHRDFAIRPEFEPPR